MSRRHRAPLPRSLLPGIALCAALGCAAAADPAPPRPAAKPVAVALPPPRSEPIDPPPPRPPPPNRCWPPGVAPPAPRPAAAAPAPLPCQKRDAAVERRVAADLRARYSPEVKGSKVEVAFGCDGLDRGVARIVVEEGSGHGGGLTIWRLERAADAPEYRVIGVRLRGYFLVKHGERDAKIARGAVPAAEIDRRLGAMRAALGATIREIEPPPPRAGNAVGAHGRSGFMSSHDFHVRLRLEDAAGRVVARHYTGYEASDGQATYLPVQRAFEPIAPLLEPFDFRDEDPDDEVRALFDERFLDAEARFHDQFAWWVRERYVQMAASLGTRALVPSLVRLLGPPKDDASSTRTRDGAVAALAAITGWDARRTPAGDARSTDDAARDYLEECGRIPGEAATEPPR